MEKPVSLTCQSDFCAVVKEDKTKQKGKDLSSGNQLPPWISSPENVTQIRKKTISFAVFLPQYTTILFPSYPII